MTHQPPMQSNHALQASAYVGRTVLICSNTIFLTGSEGAHVVIDVPDGAPNIEIWVVSVSGILQKRWLLERSAAGLLPVYWDGLNQAGERLPMGYYSLIACDENGMDLPVMVAANVDSVSPGTQEEGVRLNVSGVGDMALDQVRWLE